MKFLALGLKVNVLLFLIFCVNSIQAQHYTNLLYPEDLDSVHAEVQPIIWGCEYCVQPLRHNIKLDWEITYNPISDPSKNLIDSLILDFSRTPGFSLSAVNILDSNLVQISPTRLLILEGTSRIKELVQIDINQIDSSLYVGRELEIDILSVIQGNRKLFPVIADVIIIPKVLNNQIHYADLGISIFQKLGEEILAEWSAQYKFRPPPVTVSSGIYSVSEYNTIVRLINLLPNLSSTECTIQKIKPKITYYPPSFWPCYKPIYPISKKFTEIPSLSLGSKFSPHKYSKFCCCSHCWCWPYPKYPCWPKWRPFIITPVPSPPIGMSLIAVEADAFDPSDPLPTGGNSHKFRPTLALDGFDGTMFHDDELIEPFHFLRLSADLSDPKVLYLFLVPEIFVGSDNSEIFIYNRKNQVCHLPLNQDLSGSYYVRMKNKYEPEIKFYNVKENASDPDNLSKISNDLAVLAYTFDELSTGIDFNSNIPVSSVQQITLPNLESKLSSLVYFTLSSNHLIHKRPKGFQQMKNDFPTHFSANTINVYYMDMTSIDVTVETSLGVWNTFAGISNSNLRGIYVFKNIIIIDPVISSSKTLTHEIGHLLGLQHVAIDDVLDCDFNFTADATRELNVMCIGIDCLSCNSEFTLAQIMRMNTKPYSFINTSAWRNIQNCRVCEEHNKNSFYRKDSECPCLGLDN